MDLIKESGFYSPLLFFTAGSKCIPSTICGTDHTIGICQCIPNPSQRNIFEINSGKHFLSVTIAASNDAGPVWSIWVVPHRNEDSRIRESATYTTHFFTVTERTFFVDMKNHTFNFN